MAMARIVLDTDVVSYHRAGRLPAEYGRLVATGSHCITFATAAELWKGALDKRWGGARRAGLDL
jgi:predicted nucleic acid-binding protein